MSRQRFITLLVVAALAISGALYLSAQRNVRRDTHGAALIPTLAGELNTVTALSVRRGSAAPTVMLHEKDGRWTVAERGDYPADVAKLRKLLLALSDAKIVEEKTSNPANFAVIGVEDPSSPTATGAEISVTARDGKHAVIIGKPVGGGNFARRSGDNASYSVEPGISFETEPRFWIDSRLLDVAVAGIQRIEVKPAAAPAYTVRRVVAAPTNSGAAGAASSAASGTAGSRGTVGSTSPAAASSTNSDTASSTSAGIAGSAASSNSATASPVNAGAGPAASPKGEDSFALDGVPAGRKAADSVQLAPSPTAFSGLIVDDVTPVGDVDFSKATVATVTLSDGNVITLSGAVIGDKHWIQVKASKDAALDAKTAGRAFDVAGYRFDAIFRPLEQLLVPKEAPAAKKKPATTAAGDSAKHPAASKKQSSTPTP
ncbi:MAG TPA: DUF4340 domain-containing protein [Steroidobacteraceae bacterium]|nr:DUF4340 domain-containing protein [Steroidobacteraceae bacterium]